MPICRCCKINKVQEEFYAHKETITGYEYRCKVCNNTATINSINKIRSTIEGYFQYLQSSCKGRAKAGNLEYSLLKGDIYKKFIEQQGMCAITGKQLTTIVDLKNKYTRPHTNASIDRINPSLGYTLDNIQLVCYIVNIMKHNMSMKQLKYWCRKVLK